MPENETPTGQALADLKRSARRKIHERFAAQENPQERASDIILRSELALLRIGEKTLQELPDLQAAVGSAEDVDAKLKEIEGGLIARAATRSAVRVSRRVEEARVELAETASAVETLVPEVAAGRAGGAGGGAGGGAPGGGG